jgi:hypothetical protein
MHHGKSEGNEIKGDGKNADHGKGDPRKKDSQKGVLHEWKF